MVKRRDLIGSAQLRGAALRRGRPAGISRRALALHRLRRRAGKATIGEYSRIVLRVDDVRRAHRELVAKGVRFETEPFDLPDGTFAAIRDPWGNVFGLADSTNF
jgi:catechol 2,3-dioxygenase-like lactoylglutathione lyase family enzyme